MNSIQLIGRLIKDANVKELDDKKVVQFNLAVNYGVEKVLFIQVSHFCKLTSKLENFLVKGQQVGIVGQLQQNEWEDKNGNKRNSFSVLASSITLVGKKTNSQEQEQEQENSEEIYGF